jgi:hypothetical protein
MLPYVMTFRPTLVRSSARFTMDLFLICKKINGKFLFRQVFQLLHYKWERPMKFKLPLGYRDSLSSLNYNARITTPSKFQERFLCSALAAQEGFRLLSLRKNSSSRSTTAQFGCSKIPGPLRKPTVSGNSVDRMHVNG